jgi:hypothetical protein
MSKFSASDAAFVGFRLVREHPKTIGIWAVVMTVLSLASTALTIQLAGPRLTEFMAISAQGDPSPQEMLGVMGGLAPLMCVSLVYSLVLYSVMLGAVNRMILRPADNGSAYLRLGADELRQAIMLILVNLLMLGVYFAVVLVSAILLAIAVASGVGALTAIAGLVSFVGICCLMIFVAVRLSFASAITFDTGKVSVTQSCRRHCSSSAPPLISLQPPLLVAGQHVLQVAAGPAGLDLGHVLGRAHGDDLAAAVAAFGTEVQQPVGGLHDVEVMLDDDHGVALVDQLVQHFQQLLGVLEVQAGGRLVEDVERAAGGALAELLGQLHALGLAARQGRRLLADLDVARPTRLSVSILSRIGGTALKKSAASSTVMSRMSAMVLPLNRTSRVSRL